MSPHQPGRVYVAGERHRVSDRAPYLYKTEDYGKSWQRITDGIRENDFSWVIREDPVRAGLLYAGTETGAYVSFDDGAAWQSLQGNLPPAMVMHMRVKDDDLVVATHGRGIWILDNISSLRAVTPELAAAPVHLFEVVPAVRRLMGGRGWTKFRGGAKNPPSGVIVEYHLARAADNPVTIAIAEADGKIVREFSGSSGETVGPSAHQGMNRFAWDMRYPGTVMPPPNGPLDGFISVDYSPPATPLAPPGQYRIRLSVDGEDFERPFEILRDPRARASDDDLRAQFDLMIDIRDRFTEVADTVLKIRDIRAALEKRRGEMPDNAGLKADAMLKELRQIEGTLMIWMGSDAHPMMWSAPGLTEKLSSLSSAVISGDARPTESMYAVFADISERFERQRSRLNRIVEQELAPLRARETER